MKRFTKGQVLARHRPTDAAVRKMRFDAHDAFLDGRIKWAKELNRRADILERARTPHAS